MDSTSLPYPLGIADFANIIGMPPEIDTWRRVPQFIYMGADDTNDALLFNDGYEPSERAIAFKTIGETMQPDRWERCQAIYRASGANVTFKTYAGIGHMTNPAINTDIVTFLQAHLTD